MMTLSTGDPSTLGIYLKLCKSCGFSKSASYFEEKIEASSKGESEEVIAPESQMMFLIQSLEV